MVEQLNDYEYSILDEIRRDEINQAIEKAEKWDMIERTDPDATIPILDNIDLRQQIKQLKDSDEVLREKIRIFVNEIQSLKSQLEKSNNIVSPQDVEKFNRNTAKLHEEIDNLKSKNEKLNKVIDEINQYIDTPLQVQNGTRNKIKSILSNLEVESPQQTFQSVNRDKE